MSSPEPEEELNCTQQALIGLNCPEQPHLWTPGPGALFKLRLGSFHLSFDVGKSLLGFVSWMALDLWGKKLVSSYVLWMHPRPPLWVAHPWSCTLNEPCVYAAALSAVLALSVLAPDWGSGSWFILSCLGLRMSPVTSVLLKSCGMAPWFLSTTCVLGSYLLVVGQHNPCCSLSEVGRRPWGTLGCGPRHRPGSLEVFGEQ